MAASTYSHRVIIIGAGFGGLQAARKLANKPVDVLVIDRNNYHTFTPLLYQVATSALDPSEIAYPVRSIFRKYRNINFMLGEVTGIDYGTKTVTVRTNGHSHSERYDDLIIATGTVTNFFGMGQVEQSAFGLKSLSDAVLLRNHILRQLEKAAWTDDESERAALTTLVVVGGGATGLETAGALYELYNYVLKREYPNSGIQARVILLEAADYLLAPYPANLRQAALQQLQTLGIEVRLGQGVTDVQADVLVLSNGETLHTHTLVWAAGVRTSLLLETLNMPLSRGGRIPIEPTMRVIGLDHVYAIGDIAYLEDDKGEPYPQLIAVANQQGKLASANILSQLKGEPQKPFHYTDLGIMATIGRSRAVAWLFYRIQLRGFLAWQAWLWFHLIMLIGFRNRFMVLTSWLWNYITYDRSVRIILEMQNTPRQESETDVARQ